MEVTRLLVECYFDIVRANLQVLQLPLSCSLTLRIVSYMPNAAPLPECQPVLWHHLSCMWA